MTNSLGTMNQTLRAIMAYKSEDTDAPIGFPSYRGSDIEEAATGMVPRDITWSADRGNWMWDGALALLTAQGIDPAAPL